MAILVDELREYPDTRLPFTAWCHMASDRDFDELHAFAARLGLRRAWFQRDHYDLPSHGRAAALALGAEAVPGGELLERMAGPRGDRARRRGRTPAGVLELRGGDGTALLRYPAGALVCLAGGTATRASRLADSVPVLGAPWSELDAALRAGRGAVALVGAPRDARRLARAGAPAHLLLLGAAAEAWRALARPGDPAPFASIVIADHAAADRLRRLAIGLPRPRLGGGRPE
jgi:hypothetical protein